jgi:hypothetical protein
MMDASALHAVTLTCMHTLVILPVHLRQFQLKDAALESLTQPGKFRREGCSYSARRHVPSQAAPLTCDLTHIARLHLGTAKTRGSEQGTVPWQSSLGRRGLCWQCGQPCL